MEHSRDEFCEAPDDGEYSRINDAAAAARDALNRAEIILRVFSD